MTKSGSLPCGWLCVLFLFAITRRWQHPVNFALPANTRVHGPQGHTSRMTTFKLGQVTCHTKAGATLKLQGRRSLQLLQGPKANSQVWAASQHMDQQSEQNPADGDIDKGFTIAAGGTALLLAMETVLFFITGKCPREHWVHLSLLGALIVAVVVLVVMRTKSYRDSLSRASNRVISISLLVSFGSMAVHTIWHLALLVLGLSESICCNRVTEEFNTILVCLLGIFTARVSFKALQQTSLPAPVKDPRRRARSGYVKTWIAGGLFILILEQLILGAELFVFSWTDLGSLRCFVVSAALFACYDAMLAGTSQIQMKPVRMMSLALAADGIMRLIVAVATRRTGEMILAAGGSLCSLGFWAFGTYKYKQDRGEPAATQAKPIS